MVVTADDLFKKFGTKVGETRISSGTFKGNYEVYQFMGFTREIPKEEEVKSKRN